MKWKFGLTVGLALVLGLAVGSFGLAATASAEEPPAEEQLFGLPSFDGIDHPWLVHSIIVGAAETIGIDPEEVKQGLRNGQSLNQIAESHGVGPYELAHGILEHERQVLHRLVMAGEIRPWTAARLMHFLTEHIRLIINYQLPVAP